MSKKKRILWGILGGAVLLLCSVGFWVNSRIQASLPLLDGAVVCAGLEHEVSVERDALGIPTITSSSRNDTACALGWVHAQDRFFQMDLLRRQSAGRLSELFGEAAFETDKSFRRHRFEALAAQVVDRCSREHRELLQAYSNGVNAGLAQLAASPFEYLLLRVSPEPWKPTDCVLVTMTMFCDLQERSGQFEYLLGELRNALPSAAFDFVARLGTKWDATVDGSTSVEPEIPAATIWNLRDNTAQPKSVTTDDDLVFGSNNWAVDSSLTADGRAILASDMHLRLSVPTIWYRAVMHTPAIKSSRPIRLVGVTLPGTPALIAGSNGSIAWGFTNSMGDFGDIVELSTDPNVLGSYLTADGPREFETMAETIHIKGGEPRSVEYLWTIWGPVSIEQEDANGLIDATGLSDTNRPHGRLFVHHWVGQDVRAIDFGMLEFESATDVEQAVAIANTCGMPHSNLVCADSQGHIGWTIAGRIPRREARPPRTPLASTDRFALWDDYVPAEECPRVVNPKDGRLWTANARVVGGKDGEMLGGNYVLGSRATQIRERLFAKNQFTEKAMLEIQLDNEAVFLQPWRDLLLEVLATPQCTVSDEFQTFVKNWGGRAAVDSVGYRLVRRFRQRVVDSLVGAVMAGSKIDPKELPRTWLLQREGFAWQLVRDRPPHLLPGYATSWEEFLARHAVDVEAELTKDQPLSAATWGARNMVNIQHPLSHAVPALSTWLDMPAMSLPGDTMMIRVQHPHFGASNRLVVSPGHEEDGIFHMPGGQSGHPRSPFYRTGFQDWAKGRPTPLLPGPPMHTLVLEPAAN